MPITVIWDNDEKTAFHWIFEGKWNWKEYAQAMDQADKLAKEVEHPIDVIVNMAQSKLIPSHALSNIRAKMGAEPHKLGLVVIITNNPLVKAIGNALPRLNRRFENKIAIAATVEQARQTIAQRRKPGIAQR